MLPDCLAALQRQDYGGPYEVIVVNNASTDRSPDIARACGVRLVDEPRKGNVNALRAGISAAQGEIIACTDADMRVPPDWLSRLVTTLTAHLDIVATRGVTVYFDGSPCLRALSRVIGPLVWHMCGANMAFTRNSRSWLFATTAFVALLCMFIFCATSSGAQVFGPVLSHGPVGPRVVAITFDDGPSPYTAQVLDILARYQVKATFFVIGQNVERHPELASRIVAEGHEIGNHTYSHPLAGAIETPQRFEGELDRTATVIRAAAGVSPTLFRGLLL